MDETWCQLHEDRGQRWKKKVGGRQWESRLSGRLSEFLSSESVREDEWIKEGKGTECSSGKKKTGLDEKHEGGRYQCRNSQGDVKGRVRQWAK